MKIFTCLLFVWGLLHVSIAGKGGSRSSSSSSRSSSSRGSSSSGGWFSSSRPSSPSYSSPSYSSPAYSPSSYSSPSYSSPSYSSPSYKSPSYSSPSYSSPSYSSPSSSSSYGWNLSPSRPSSSSSSNTASKPATYGWNLGNTQNTATNTASKPGTIGWNVQPVGPPPAYPGLSTRPVSNPMAPPSYSPSFSNPPAYSPSYPSQPAYKPSYSSPSYSQPSYNPSYSSPSYNSPSYVSKPSYTTSYRNPSYSSPSYSPSYYNSYSNYKPNYGSTFGNQGLGSNTYIHNNYYGSSRSNSGSGFLTNALFYGAGTHSGYHWGRSSSYRRSWNEDEDRRWRATTQAPYFANKVPGSTNYLPAAAVVGAATAFGLASLLPLNVPADKPLMYCNSTEVAQNPIYLDFNIYSCVNETISISCPRAEENSTIVDACLNQTFKCDVEKGSENLYCSNGTLFSQSPIFCNSTTLHNGTAVNETTLNCYRGQISEGLASFIPTTTTEAPVETTTEKQLSWKSRIHVFFMKLIGKGDVIEKAQQTTTTVSPIDENPRFVLAENETAWVPEALTIPPETANSTNSSTTTTERTTTHGPLQALYQLENGTLVMQDFKYATPKTPPQQTTTVLSALKQLENGTLVWEDIKFGEESSTTEASGNVTMLFEVSTIANSSVQADTTTEGQT